VMLFATCGRSAGGPEAGLAHGLGIVAVGTVLAGITMARGTRGWTLCPMTAARARARGRCPVGRSVQNRD
jgi:hypothetical protein